MKRLTLNVINCDETFGFECNKLRRLFFRFFFPFLSLDRDCGPIPLPEGAPHGEGTLLIAVRLLRKMKLTRGRSQKQLAEPLTERGTCI